MDYIFLDRPEFAEPIRVLFLCGAKFKDSDSDKRIVLKGYLERDPKNRVILLEKYFDFRNKGNATGLLSYYAAHLFNLHSIETLAALVATNVIIIHETMSTAGEIGTFASNKELRNRIITLVPEKYSVEEDKLSAFLKLAFWNKKDRLVPNNVIRFYPVIKRSIISEKRSFFETYFYNNIFPEHLGEELQNQLVQNPSASMILFENFQWHPEKNIMKIWLRYPVVKNYLFAILSVSENRKVLRECHKIYEIRNFLNKKLTGIIGNTYYNKTGKQPKVININIANQPDLKLDDVLNFMIYCWHVCNIMKISCNNDETISVSFPKHNMSIWKCYSELIKPITFAVWGE